MIMIMMVSVSDGRTDGGWTGGWTLTRASIGNDSISINKPMCPCDKCIKVQLNPSSCLMLSGSSDLFILILRVMHYEYPIRKGCQYLKLWAMIIQIEPSCHVPAGPLASSPCPNSVRTDRWIASPNTQRSLSFLFYF